MESHRLLYPCLALLLISALPPGAAAAPIYAVQGEEIPLGGVATGTDVVYLFLTGPNLPDQGIALTGGDPVVTGVPGSFTRVDVNTDGTWTYTWRTGSLGRILDTGTYLVFIAEEPRARPDLDDSVYSEQSVIIGAPVETVTVEIPVTVPATVTTLPGTTQEGPVVTGPPAPAGTTMVPGTPSPVTTSARVCLPTMIPLAAAALALLVSRRRS